MHHVAIDLAARVVVIHVCRYSLIPRPSLAWIYMYEAIVWKMNLHIV